MDNLSGLMQGWDSLTPDIDLQEILNQLCHFSQIPNCSIAISINRDLIFGNQKTIYREFKNNEFNLVFEVNRNEAGYNYKDVHGQLLVISNRLDSMRRIDLLENCEELQKVKQIRFKLCENRIDVFESYTI